MNWSKFNKLVLCLAIPAALASACEINEPCDPGQEVVIGLCVDPVAEPEAEGGAGGAEMCEERDPPEGEANPGAACTEGGDECQGGTECGAPELPQCVALCGPCDVFFDNCQAGTTCTEFPQASVCF